jgi:hypothetical protein
LYDSIIGKCPEYTENRLIRGLGDGKGENRLMAVRG